MASKSIASCGKAALDKVGMQKVQRQREIQATGSKQEFWRPRRHLIWKFQMMKEQEKRD